jgi:hypothetical protein
MARFILSNDNKKHDTIVDDFLKAGFDRNAYFTANNFKVTSFRKITDLNNKNSYKYENGDFICVCGTFIYNRETGIRAIQYIYSDFNDNVSKIKNNILGHYSCILKKGNYIYVFGDKLNIHKIYYFKNLKEILISQDLYKIATVIKNKSINDLALLQRSFQFDNLDDETIFNEIKILKRNEYLKINIEDSSVQKEKIIIDNKENIVKSSSVMAKELSSYNL